MNGKAFSLNLKELVALPFLVLALGIYKATGFVGNKALRFMYWLASITRDDSPAPEKQPASETAGDQVGRPA